MAVLKKIKASTLMETLIATVLVVVTFLLASMILNNLVSNAVTSNTMAIDTHLIELQYLQQHQQLEMPYSETLSKLEHIRRTFSGTQSTLNRV